VFPVNLYDQQAVVEKLFRKDSSDDNVSVFYCFLSASSQVQSNKTDALYKAESVPKFVFGRPKKNK